MTTRATTAGRQFVEKASVCTLDCPDTCSLTVRLVEGRIDSVRGSHANPFTDGVLCAKVTRDTAAFVHGDHRLLHPLRRVGPKGAGRFERVSWDQALDEVHGRVGAVIERFGPQAVMPLNYAGPHGMIAGDSMSMRFFHKLGASQLHRRALCGGVRSEAWTGTYGPAPGIAPEFAEHARLNIVWGNNATVTNLHLVRRIARAKRHGAKLVVVDPLRTKIAEQADLHLALNPATDVLLAWAVAVELERMGAIDRAFVDANVEGYEPFMARAREWPAEKAAGPCGLAALDIRRFAAWIAEAEPVVLSIGNGLERTRNGGSGIRAAIALPALAGKMGRKGDAVGGIILGAGYSFAKTNAKLQRPDLLAPGTRTLNINDVGRHLAEDDIAPPLRALFIYNHNPIVVHPDQNRIKRGLARDELFTVGIDVAMTESMAHCDVILPAATQFEYPDLYPAYGHHWLQRAEAVLAPLGESLPNTEIFRRLAARFGFSEPCFKASDDELMDDAIDPADPRLGGRRPHAIPTDKAVAMNAPDGRPLVLFDNVRPATPSGKIELESETLAKRWGERARLAGWRSPDGAPGGPWPLSLISPASDRQVSSTFGNLRREKAPMKLIMHARDAAARDLRQGQRVRVWNDRGAVVLALDIGDAVRPGVVASEKGAWLATSETGQTISALVSADLKADLCEGACFNDTRVEVAAA